MVPMNRAPTGPRKRASRAAKVLEKVIHTQVEAYLKLFLRRGLKFVHLPDAMMRAAFQKGKPVSWALLKAGKHVRGVPDFLVFHKKAPGRVLLIEMKTDVGVVSGAQSEWEEFGAVVCRSFEEARDVIDRWLREIDA